MSNGKLEKQVERAVDSFEDAVSFPILTTDAGIPTSNGSGGSRGGVSLRGGSIGSLAERTIREVIGWRYRRSDSKGFVAALSKTFSLAERNGHIEWSWNPQSYSVAADLGEITGAQASLHAQAKVIVENSLPLLEVLKPLRTDADIEEMEAIRIIISDELNGVLAELGRGCGPRVYRMDSFFDLLLLDNEPGSPDEPDPDPQNMRGQMLTLRERFGLDSGRVGTVEEERNFTNYLVLADQVFALYRMWDTKRDQFASGIDQFLGLQLISLSQLLEVIAESVHEAYAAMDSVFLGPEERQVYDLELEDGVRMTIEDLFDWIENIATVEGPRLLAEGGKDGVLAFHHTVGRLADLVDQAITDAESEDDDDTDNGQPGTGSGFQSARVQRALRELRRHLDQAAKKSGEVDRREVSIEPQIKQRREPKTKVYESNVLHRPLIVKGNQK
jgi:hypothetical protein